MRCLRLLVPFSLAALLLVPRIGAACGCFAPPDPASPVVQAGENILFSVANGQVTAWIQIRYSGNAADFGWLLPLPSVPTLEVSSEEVFARLSLATTPRYQLKTVWDDHCVFSPDLGSFTPDFGVPGNDAPADPLVTQGGVGPYDYAVLRADDKHALLDWLAANRYFVPEATDSVIGNYIHPGAYFLALKLKSDKGVGDLQPVVVHYASDLPMIPLTLTSATAQDRMAVNVWVLGAARAVPRNYYHVILDDAALDWPTDGLPGNYDQVVYAAVHETMGHHGFITEMATKSATVAAQSFPDSRFGNLDQLRQITNAAAYLDYLKRNDYNFSQTLVSILQKYIKQPPHLQFGRTSDPSPANYYYNFSLWFYNNPNAFQGFDLSFDPVALTNEIEAKIVKPVRDVAAVMKTQSYLTRLSTRLDAADMNSDPVFSFNPQLPDVSANHNGTAYRRCGNGDDTVVTESGFVRDATSPPVALPGALRIETLGDSGPAKVVTDNTQSIRRALGQFPPPDGAAARGNGGCSVSRRSSPRALLGLPALLALAALAVRRRRR